MASIVPNVKQEDKFFNVKKEFLDNLEEHITCSQCQKVPRDPTVSWCSAHHLMCQSCYDTKVKPADLLEPVLPLELKSSNLDDTFESVQPLQLVQPVQQHVQCGEDCKVERKPELSPFVASILKEVPTKCKFNRNGCQVFIVLKELKVHEDDCVYRNIDCPFLDCHDENVSFIGLDEHLEANHGDLKRFDNGRSKDFVFVSLTKIGNGWIPQQITFRNRSFFTRVNHDAHEDYIEFWVDLHGTLAEASHYSYRIKIIGSNDRELTFKGKVDSLECYGPNSLHFHLYADQVELFQVDAHDKINFEVTLYSDKEEIKNEDVESGISDIDDEQ